MSSTGAVPYALLTCQPDKSSCSAIALPGLMGPGQVQALVQIPDVPAQTPATAAGGTALAAGAGPKSGVSAVTSITDTLTGFASGALAWVSGNLVLILLLVGAYWFFFKRRR